MGWHSGCTGADGKEVPMKHLSSVIAGALVTAWFAAGVHAQAVLGEPSNEAKPDAKRQGEATDRDREKKGELEFCKNKAQGLDGPDRARFLTDCLRGSGRM
jgi:hypothetical protein